MKKFKTTLCLIFTFTLLTSSLNLSTFISNKNHIENFCDNEFKKQ